MAKGNGDLTAQIIVPQGDEISVIAQNINEFIEKVRITVSKATSTSTENLGIARTMLESSHVMQSKADKERSIVHTVCD